MSIHGTYLSAYQGPITDEAVEKLIANGIRFVGLRLTQGKGYVDPTWEHNAAMLQDTSILLLPWHFATTDSADKQYANFIAQVEKFDRWRLPPGLDCEAYTSRIPSDTMAVRESIYGLAYPTEATIDAIGRWLTQWMAGQPALKDYVYPAIYTNAGSGNVIFKTKSMKRYLLWVANWHSPNKPPLEKPYLPAVWAGTPWYIWQDLIIDGAPYGIKGQISREWWGPLLPFPGDEPTPPPVSDYEMTLKQNGQIYAGKLEAKA